MADLIAVLLASLAGFFGSGADPAQLARAMEQAVLATQPVPIAAAEVSCLAESGDGLLDEVSFSLAGLTLDPLEIEHVEIAVAGISQRAGGSVSFDSIAWSARIDDTALTDALRLHVKKLADAQVTAHDEVITLKGTYPMWPVRIPYEVDGTLVVENQTELVFRIERTGVSGVRLPSTLNHLIETEVNPVYDLSKFAARSKKDLDRAKAKLDYEFNLQVKEITAGDGFLLVKGGA